MMAPTKPATAHQPVLNRRYPCCKGSVKFDAPLAAGQVHTKQCSRCRRTWTVTVQRALITETHPDMKLLRLSWTQEEADHGR